MKTFYTTNLCSLTLVGLLAGCGGDEYQPVEKTENVAPSHGGDIVQDFHEQDDFQFLYLLGTPTGAESGVGIAIDTDGDVLTVTNLSTNLDQEDALLGIEIDGARVGVRPTALADSLDTGDVHQVVLSYDISDGVTAIPRTMTINIAGEDAAPVFEDLALSFTKFDPSGSVDLLTDVFDADGEPLMISDFVADPSNTIESYQVNGNQFTLDIASFADSIAIGETLSLSFSYQVQDHNHSLTRQLTINVRGVRPEPLPPEIISTYSGTFGTNADPVVIDLADDSYTVEWNGDPLFIDFDNITPTNGGPALAFNKSQGTTLVIDPIDFAQHLANVGDSATYHYSFVITDGDEGDTAGHQVETGFEITVTKEAPLNLILNGSFEDGLNDWTVDTSIVASTDSASAWQGEKVLAATGFSELTSNSFNVAAAGAYHISYAEQNSDWGRYNVHITGGETEQSRSFGLHPTFADPWVDFAIRSLSFEMPLDSRSQTRALRFETLFNQLDDVQVSRYSTDNANNLVYTGASASSVNFDGGTQGNWEAGEPSHIEITDVEGEVISGSHSLVVSGPAFVTLPEGSIVEGKRYLLKLDIRQLEFNQAFGNVVMFQILDASTWTPFYANPDEHPRSIDLLDAPIGEVTSFQQVIDASRVGQISAWDTLPVAIEINPTVWGAPGKVVIDNIQLIELP